MTVFPVSRDWDWIISSFLPCTITGCNFANPLPRAHSGISQQENISSLPVIEDCTYFSVNRLTR
jgi:hypothetical protein